MVRAEDARLSGAQRQAWVELVKVAVAHSISGLSVMVGREVTASRLDARSLPVGEVPEALGGAATYAVGVTVAIENRSGHLGLVCEPETAGKLIDVLLDRPDGSTVCSDLGRLSELERSALGEMGNVMGTFFLNAVADRTGCELRPTPPVVAMDMTGAILDAPLAEILMEADDLVMVDALFGTHDRKISGTFIVMPGPGLLKEIMVSWGKE
jgi:chemotaxis protein CheC